MAKPTLKSDVAEIKGHIDRLATAVEQQSVTAVKQQLSLDEHIRRTEALEGRVAPLERSEVRWAVAAKILAGGGGLVGVVLAALKAMGH